MLQLALAMQGRLATTTDALLGLCLTVLPPGLGLLLCNVQGLSAHGGNKALILPSPPHQPDLKAKTTFKMPPDQRNTVVFLL